MRWPNHMRSAKVRPLLRLPSLSHQMWQHFLLKHSVLWVLLAICQFTSVNQVSKRSPAFCQQSKEIVLNAILVKSLLRADWTTWCYFLKVKCYLGASIFSVHIFLKKNIVVQSGNNATCSQVISVGGCEMGSSKRPNIGIWGDHRSLGQ